MATTAPPRRRIRGRSLRWARKEGAREIALFAVAYLTYFGVRVLTSGDAAQALANARDLMRTERLLGLDWERAVQQAVIGRSLLVALVNGVYMYGHWPVILVAGVLLFRYGRRHYYRFRNACMISGAIGLVIFALLPVAPPRLTDLPLVDTVTANAEGYRQIVPKALVNQYAAMPSFHAGWNILLGIVVFQATRNLLLRLLAVVGPASMALATVATANHYVVDVVVASLIVAVSLALAIVVERRPIVVVHGRLEPPAGSTLRRRAPRRQ